MKNGLRVRLHRCVLERAQVNTSRRGSNDLYSHTCALCIAIGGHCLAISESEVRLSSPSRDANGLSFPCFCPVNVFTLCGGKVSIGLSFASRNRGTAEPIER